MKTFKLNHRLIKILRPIGKAALTLFILASIAAAGSKLAQHSQLDQGLDRLEFLFAVGLAIAYRTMNPLGWVAVLRGLGHRVHAVAATNVWLISESRRWLPGGIWGYTSRAVRAKSLGVPAKTASASMLVELFVTLLAAILVSIVGLMLHYDAVGALVADCIEQHFSWNLAVLAACGGMGLAGACYAGRGKLADKLNALNEKWQLLDSAELNFRQLAIALGYFVVMACLNGAVNLAMLRSCTEANVPATAMIAATAGAWVVGYLAFFSPGGLFVREGALAVLLMPWIPYQVAFTLAILSRIAQLIAEVVCMIPSALTTNRTWAQQPCQISSNV